MEVPAHPDLSRVSSILENLPSKPPANLAEEVVGILHRHHVMLKTIQRASPSDLRLELKEVIAGTGTAGGQLLNIAGLNCSDAALRQLAFAEVEGEPLRKTAERCLDMLEDHPRGPQGVQKFDAYLVYLLRKTFADHGIATPASFDLEENKIIHPATVVIYQLLRLVWPHLSVQGFRNRCFYKAK